MNKYHFKLKGAGPMTYHLRRDGYGTMHFAPRENIENMEECCCSMFGSNPKLTFVPPLEEDDHPALDDFV